MAKKYKVGNPNGIPSGLAILSRRIDEKEFFEGDDWYPAEDWSAKTRGDIIKDRLARGYLIEVNDG